MRAIIDTNILVSAAISDRKPEAVILHIVRRPQEFEWAVSEEILTEYKTVLSRSRLRLTAEDREQWFTLLEDTVRAIAVEIEVDFPRDIKDAKFLACAIAANADFLITGDRDFEEIESLSGTQIVSASRFLELIEVD